MKKICVKRTAENNYRQTKRGPYPMPMRERVSFAFKDKAAMERSLMRHSWYRNKLAWDALRIAVGQA